MTYKIKLPMPLASVVNGILRDKYHYPDHRQKNGQFDDTFTREELSKITELTFTGDYGPNCCNGVNLLPNLTKLVVTRKENTNYTRPDEVRSISILSQASIQCCKHLESLTIENQVGLLGVDVSQMSHLKELNISNNSRLNYIHGLDKLTQLHSLTCVGNERLFRIASLDKMIENQPDLKYVDLDVLLFPSAIGYDVASGQFNAEALHKMQLLPSKDCTWTQVAARTDSTHYIPTAEFKMCHLNLKGITTLHNTACQTLARIVPPNASIQDTIVAIEMYLAANVFYDKEGENVRAKAKKVREDPDGIRDSTAYNCLVGKSCVCAGFARGMQYLLALKGIKSHYVTCNAVPDKNGLHDSRTALETAFIPLGHQTQLDEKKRLRLHAILCVDDFGERYCDPTADAKRYQVDGDRSLPRCCMTREQAAKHYILSIHERGRGREFLKPSTPPISESIKSNALFLKTKGAEVIAWRAKFGERPIPAKGMIPTGRI